MIVIIIRFSTPNIASLVFLLGHSTPVISSYSESNHVAMHCANGKGAEKKAPNVQTYRIQ